MQDKLKIGRPDVRTDLDELADAGLVHLYEVEGDWYFEIDSFDADQFGDTIRKRGKSDYPVNPAQNKGQESPATTADQGQEKGRKRAAKGQDAPAPRADLGQANRTEQNRTEHGSSAAKAAASISENGPSAARSTDTRAYERPVADAPTAPLAVADGGAAAAPARSSIEELLAGDVDRWETYNGTQKQQDAHAFLRLLAKHRPVTQTDLDAIYMRADKPPKELGYTGTHKALAKASLEGWPGWTSKDPLVSLMALFEQERANGAALARQAMEHVRARLEKDVETSPEAKVVNPDDAWKLPPPDPKAAFARMRAEILAGKGR